MTLLSKGTSGVMVVGPTLKTFFGVTVVPLTANISSNDIRVGCFSTEVFSGGAFSAFGALSQPESMTDMQSAMQQADVTKKTERDAVTGFMTITFHSLFEEAVHAGLALLRRLCPFLPDNNVYGF
jgi:hypothetical protein